MSSPGNFFDNSTKGPGRDFAHFSLVLAILRLSSTRELGIELFYGVREIQKIEKNIFCFFRWSQMVPTQCDSLAVFRKSKWSETSARKRQNCPWQCDFPYSPLHVKVVRNSRPTRVNGCAVLCCCAVLWSAVLRCCGVCVCVWCRRHVFAHFPEKNALPSMMFAFRSL